jgi:alpha-glucosidase
MPWDADAANLGFSTGEPWLPVADAHRDLAVSRQLVQPDSVLGYTRRFLAARKASPALRHGEIAFVEAPDPVLAFTRSCDGEQILCIFNMSDQAAAFSDPRIEQGTSLGLGFGEIKVLRKNLELGPCATTFIRC